MREPGERVKWTHVRRTANGGCCMSTREGRVVRDCGSLVVVRYRGHHLSVLPEKLRSIGDKSELVEFLESADAP